MIPPDPKTLASNCNCDEWAEKVNAWTWKSGKASTTFTCPVHGTVTIDNRDLPAPVVNQTPDEDDAA